MRVVDFGSEGRDVVPAGVVPEHCGEAEQQQRRVLTVRKIIPDNGHCISHRAFPDQADDSQQDKRAEN